MAGKKVGIREISERAGVAISTVSHVLNGTAPISDEVRTRVLDAARETGYLARRRAKGAIAALSRVLVAAPADALPQHDVNLVSWTILSALSRECETRGLRLVPHALEPGGPPLTLIATAREIGADGIIVINDDSGPLLQAIDSSGLPAVLINGEDPDMHVDSVTAGNRFGARKATNALIALGHRRVLHLTWSGRKTVQRRLDGFRDAFAEAGLSSEDAVVLLAEGFTPACGEAAITDWLARHPDLDGVTAIFCAADNLAFGAMQALKAAGIAVPADMSVLGFDGVALGEMHSPQLTTVVVPLAEFGAEALNLLEQRVLSGRLPRAAHRVELGCVLVERGSHAPPRRP
ncbi:LacI family DNA-binding transcriptional regulator [Tropicimonas sp. IMCC34043]|uniref:LacI family DNA-binding transcriptional regulator n=1 Tax=Tropicimonas sp. IMCC34043 TaxID=2248760 RepID=UPI000E22A8A8|nr:LacI family DNA-binding transcriptional regulator [Tropicimonas sp. IMCC34043]